YLSVTPRLEASLTSQRLNGLVGDSKRYSPEIAIHALLIHNKARRDAKIRSVADAAGAEVLVYQVGPGAFNISDSLPHAGVTPGDVQDLAFRTVHEKRAISLVMHTHAGREAVVARPWITEHNRVSDVMVFADSLSDVQDNV